MAKDTNTRKKEAGPAKAASASKKATTKRKLNKGQALACEVCGLSIVVDEIGDEIVEEDSILLCCGKPMKEKSSVKKATKK